MTNRSIWAYLLIVVWCGAAFADITNWQTGETIPGTEGIAQRDLSTVSDWNTEDRNLRFADFRETNLQRADLAENWLEFSTFADADLSFAYLPFAKLAFADFSGAKITGAFLGNTTSGGFSKEQLYSTRSYQNKNLGSINLNNNDMSGWNFLGHQLAVADFQGATLQKTDFRDANLSGSDLSASVLVGADLSGSNLRHAAMWSANLMDANLAGADLNGAALGGADLTRADFRGANLIDTTFQAISFGISYGVGSADVTEANLTGTTIRGAGLHGMTDSGLTREQLYSTASYQERDLRGVDLSRNKMSSWDFSRQDMTDASFVVADLRQADLSGARLAQTNITHARLDGANLTGADLTRADLRWSNVNGADFTGAILRGADFRSAVGLSLPSSADTRNMIWPDSHIRELHLSAGQRLTFYHDDELKVTEAFVVKSGAGLQVSLGVFDSGLGGLEIDGDLPSSTHFAMSDDVSVELGGMLQVVADGGYRGRSFVPPYLVDGNEYVLFDWPSPLSQENRFSSVGLPAGDWDTSQLYTTGAITLVTAYDPSEHQGDLNLDGRQDVADLDRLALAIRSSVDLSYDVNQSRRLDHQDLRLWVEGFAGTVFGDADLNGKVEFADFLALSEGFGRVGGWGSGDFDGDGLVDFPDFLLLSDNFRNSDVGAVSVPEPGAGDMLKLACALIALGFCGRIRCRDRDELET